MVQTWFSKQCRPRSDATECGVWSGSHCFPFIHQFLDTPACNKLSCLKFQDKSVPITRFINCGLLCASVVSFWRLFYYTTAGVSVLWRRKQCCKLHYCLWRVSIKPRLSFSNLQCVLCFQRQSFWRLFICGVCFVIICSSTLFLLVPREVCAS